MNRSSIVSLSAVSVLLGLAACDKHAEPPKTPAQEVAKAEVGGDIGAALGKITAARCDRETRCDNVGAGKTYDNRGACMSSIHGKTESDLNSKECPGGIRNSELSECLGKIDAEACGNPLDTISRLASCRTGALCVSK